MVIDDSNTIRRSAEIFLLQAGCTVILAEDGFDALAKIADHQPDLIFVDIMMPRLDGYQTCALIKKNAMFTATPVIMLSSKDGLFDRARGRMVGSDQYLTKPFTKESLLKAVARARQVGGALSARAVQRSATARGQQRCGTMTIKNDSHRRRLADRAARPQRHADQGGLRGRRQRQRRGRDPQGQDGQARPDPDGRRDAGTQRLPGDARDQPRPDDAQRPDHPVHVKSQETDKIWGMRQGARDYIVKPVNRDELLAKITALG